VSSSSCQELSQKRERERLEFKVSAVEGIILCQEDVVCELKTVHML
jgi:hypothetical protein